MPGLSLTRPMEARVAEPSPVRPPASDRATGPDAGMRGSEQPRASGHVAVRNYGDPEPGLPSTIRFAATPTRRPWELQDHEFVHEKPFEAAIRETYFEGEWKRVESSRTTPQRPLDIPCGSWMLDSFNGIRGREVSQLRLVDPTILLVSEDTGGGKLDDVARYAAWMREGRVPPPIIVVETFEGHLKIVNGHRRALAAKEARVLVPAWVGPLAILADGTKTGLTLEICQNQAVWTQEEFAWEPAPCGLDLSGKYAQFYLGPAHLTYRMEPDGGVYVASLRVPREHRNRGYAERALAAFLAEADKVGVKVGLLASPLDSKTRLDRLVNLYRNHGFVVTKRFGNPAGDPEMERPSRIVSIDQ